MYRIAVTNRKLCAGDFLTRIREIAKGDTYDAVLLREKDLSEAEYEKLAEAVIRICGQSGKKLILHNYYETAIKLGHPYLHLPLSVWTEMPVNERSRLRDRMTQIGTSVHSEEQLEQAVALGADYVSAGHIFVTDCKKGFAPRGLVFLRDICLKSPVPVYAIGGIHAANEEQTTACGAAGVCVMSGCMTCQNYFHVV